MNYSAFCVEVSADTNRKHRFSIHIKGNRTEQTYVSNTINPLFIYILIYGRERPSLCAWSADLKNECICIGLINKNEFFDTLSLTFRVSSVGLWDRLFLLSVAKVIREGARSLWTFFQLYRPGCLAIPFFSVCISMLSSVEMCQYKFNWCEFLIATYPQACFVPNFSHAPPFPLFQHHCVFPTG